MPERSLTGTERGTHCALVPVSGAGGELPARSPSVLQPNQEFYALAECARVVGLCTLFLARLWGTVTHAQSPLGVRLRCAAKRRRRRVIGPAAKRKVKEGRKALGKNRGRPFHLSDSGRPGHAYSCNNDEKR